MKKIDMTKIPMAGFTAQGRKKLIDRREVVGADGEIDYDKLVRKADELGERMFRDARLLEKI